VSEHPTAARRADASTCEGLRVTVHRSAAELSEEWGRLASSLDAPIFHTTAFLRACERHPIQEVSESRFIEVRDEQEKLIGAVPAYLQADPFSPAQAERSGRALLSTIRQSSDTRVLALGPGALEAACAAFAAEAHQLDCPRWGFVNVDRASCPETELIALGFEVRGMAPRWSLPRELANDEDQYLSRLTPRIRRSLRRYRRRAADAGVVVERHGPEPPTLHRLLGLVQESSARVGAPGYYDPRHLAEFLRALGDVVEIIEVRRRDESLAVGICFREGTRYRCWAPGYVRDPSLSFSPYYILWWEALRSMWSSDATVLECGRNNDDFKRRMGLIENELVALLGPEAGEIVNEAGAP
jgi:predicted N-acyltransferase